MKDPLIKARCCIDTSYLNLITKRSSTARSSERINFNKISFSSPKCIKTSHEILMPLSKSLLKKSQNLNNSKSATAKSRKISEKLLLDVFPSEIFKFTCCCYN